MKTIKTKLPPTWVRIFSFLFLIFLISPFFAAWQIFETGSQHSISAFGLELQGGRDPLAWILAIDSILFMASLTALFILTKRSFAYDFGILYCAVALAITIPGHFLVGDWSSKAWSNITVQYPLLVYFLVHLIRNRAHWKNQDANKTVVATAGNVPRSLRSGSPTSAAPHL
jgi:hypothetical protein